MFKMLKMCIQRIPCTFSWKFDETVENMQREGKKGGDGNSSFILL